MDTTSIVATIAVNMILLVATIARLSKHLRSWGTQNWRPGKSKEDASRALLEQHAAELEATRPQRAALVEQFEMATASIVTPSPLRRYLLRLGTCTDPMLTHVTFEDGHGSSMLSEFRCWMPSRQYAALRLLCHNPFVTSLVLNGCALEDGAGEVLAV